MGSVHIVDIGGSLGAVQCRAYEHMWNSLVKVRIVPSGKVLSEQCTCFMRLGEKKKRDPTNYLTHINGSWVHCLKYQKELEPSSESAVTRPS